MPAPQALPAALRTALAASLTLCGCRATRPSELPLDEPFIVAVKSADLRTAGSCWKRFAHHTWIDYKNGAQGWKRMESLGPIGIGVLELPASDAGLDRWFDGAPVRLLGHVTGARAERAIEQLEARSSELAAAYADGYRAWPGPNSNTFVAELARASSELAFVFDPNALGKDYGGWFDAGLTASKTGVRVDTLPVGFALALREGLELHLFQFTLGVSFDPPGIALPFTPQIPFGWFEPSQNTLPPPSIQAAHSLVLDELPLGVRRELDVAAPRGSLVLDVRPRSAWLQLDYEFHVDAPDSAGGRQLDLNWTVHGLSGARRHESFLRIEAGGARQTETLRLAGEDVHFDFGRVESGALSIGIERRAPPATSTQQRD
jgi:hypothetical protein